MSRIGQLFDQMDDWRHLPSYQLERRADIFFSIYLPHILETKFGLEIEGIVPEFPVRVGTIDPKTGTNQSFKIDYLAKVKMEKKLYFIELKTDQKSRRSKQDWYLVKSRETGMIELLEGLLLIYQATSSKKKYRCLLNKLVNLGFLSIRPKNKYEIIRIFYDIGIVYIQPYKKDLQESIISFHEIASIIEKENDILSIRFAKSLREWAQIQAGDCV